MGERLFVLMWEFYGGVGMKCKCPASAFPLDWVCKQGEDKLLASQWMETQDRIPDLGKASNIYSRVGRLERGFVSQWQGRKSRFMFLGANLGGLERIIRGK